MHEEMLLQLYHVETGLSLTVAFNLSLQKVHSTKRHTHPPWQLILGGSHSIASTLLMESSVHVFAYKMQQLDGSHRYRQLVICPN